MVKKSTLIVLAVLVILAGVYLLLQKQDQLDFLTQEKEPLATPQPTFLNLDASQIVRINFSSLEGEEIILTKNSEDTWQVNTEGGEASAGNIQEIVSEFNTIKTTAVLSADIEGKAAGLDNPQYTFSIDLDSGEQKTIKIGKLNPIGTGYYAQVDVKPAVIISQGGIDNIVEILKGIAYPPTPTPMLTPTS